MQIKWTNLRQTDCGWMLKMVNWTGSRSTKINKHFNDVRVRTRRGNARESVFYTRIWWYLRMETVSHAFSMSKAPATLQPVNICWNSTFTSNRRTKGTDYQILWHENWICRTLIREQSRRQMAKKAHSTKLFRSTKNQSKCKHCTKCWQTLCVFGMENFGFPLVWNQTLFNFSHSMENRCKPDGKNSTESIKSKNILRFYVCLSNEVVWMFWANGRACCSNIFVVCKMIKINAVYYRAA